MAVANENASNVNESSFNVAEAVKQSAITGGIAFLLFVAVVGIQIKTTHSTIIPQNRLGVAIGLSLGIAVLQFLISWVSWSRAHPVKTLKVSRVKIWYVPLAAVYLIGGVFFVFRNVWGEVANTASDLFTGSAWQSHVEKGMSYVGVICVAIFVVLTAMGLLLLARRGWKIAFPQEKSPPSTTTSFASPKLTTEFAQQITPAMLIIAVILPILVAGSYQSYAVDIAVLILIYIILGWGLNIVVGLAGMLDLGYVAFYAIGAYAYVLLSHYFGWSFWVCLPIAAMLAALWGVILGFPVLRLRGDYLAIVTLAFGEIIRIVVENWSSLTNGPQGMAPAAKLTFFGLTFGRYDDNTFHQFFGLPHDPAYRVIFLYYVVFMVVIAVYFVTMRLRTQPIARAWEALREDEIACRSLGINTVTTKLTAFAMGAMFGGIGGPFLAARAGSSIFPESFRFEESALVLAIVVLGGLGSQTGIVIAAAVLVGSSEFFRDLEEYRMLLFGMAMVAIMVWRPRGLISTRIPTVALKESKTISADLVKEGAG